MKIRFNFLIRILLITFIPIIVLSVVFTTSNIIGTTKIGDILLEEEF